MEKTIILEKTIPIPLIINKRKELLIIDQSNRAIPIPVTASGGMSAEEIATPGNGALNCGFTRAKDAANPATIATPA